LGLPLDSLAFWGDYYRNKKTLPVTERGKK
jgi:hypothetical protein